MFGISIDDEPDAPVGSPATRRSVAIHWNWTTEHSREEIASALGVSERTVDDYLSGGPNDEVREQMEGVESEVRLVAVAELQDQLRAAGHRSRTAEKPVKIWADDDGNLNVREERDDETGEVLKRVPVNRDVELMPDEGARFYARSEVRDILEQLVDLVGAGEPEEVSVEHQGELALSAEDKEQLDELFDRDVQ